MMGHGYDVCPKCGIDLWKVRNEENRKEQERKYPNDCFCFSFGRIKKRDISKDEFIETKTVKSWTGPFTNTHRDRRVDIYKCHVCGKRYMYPEILFA